MALENNPIFKLCKEVLHGRRSPEQASEEVVLVGFQKRVNENHCEEMVQAIPDDYSREAFISSYFILRCAESIKGIQRDAHVFMRFSFYENHNLNIPAPMAGMLRFGLLRDLKLAGYYQDLSDPPAAASPASQNPSRICMIHSNIGRQSEAYRVRARMKVRVRPCVSVAKN